MFISHCTKNHTDHPETLFKIPHNIYFDGSVADRITIQLINLIYEGSHFERLIIVNIHTIDCAKWLALGLLRLRHIKRA